MGLLRVSFVLGVQNPATANPTCRAVAVHFRDRPGVISEGRSKEPTHFVAGAAAGIRTLDHSLTKDALYP